MQANGDHERIVNAMFECYLSKPTARAPDSAASLGFMDQLNSKINQNQYELLRYLEFSILLFRTPIRKVEIGFPKADWICRQNMVKREQLITALTTMAKTTDTDFVTVELLPLMQHLICPTNVNFTLTVGYGRTPYQSCCFPVLFVRC